MIRKLLVVAAAVAMPVTVIAVTGVTAGAKTVVPPDPAATCSISATITFAPPGISNNGSVGTSKTSTTTTSGETFGTVAGDPACSGSAPNLAISSKNTKCDKKVAGQPSSNSACVPAASGAPKNYGYDSWSNFESGGVASVQKSLKKLTFTINGITYSTKTTSAAIDGSCANGEVGFLITGTAYSPVAAGSPGPFDKNTPSGLSAMMSSAEVLAGTTVTLQPEPASNRNMLHLTP